MLSTTVLNAYLQPVMSRYLEQLRGGMTDRAPKAALGIYQPSRRWMSAEPPGAFPVRAALCGPPARAGGGGRLRNPLDRAPGVLMQFGRDFRLKVGQQDTHLDAGRGPLRQQLAPRAGAFRFRRRGHQRQVGFEQAHAEEYLVLCAQRLGFEGWKRFGGLDQRAHRQPTFPLAVRARRGAASHMATMLTSAHPMATMKARS